MDRHVTSVFSEYQTMDNNSINSKQLQHWLKQFSAPLQANPNQFKSPNLGFEWTFMSNQSSHQQRNNILEELSFGKTIHSSIEKQKGKQNNSFVSNGNNIGNNNSLVNNRSKSYVNAMIALQKKVKTLEDQNSFMRKNLTKLNEERNRSMSQSCATEQELRSKLKIIQPKLTKIDQLIEQNKSLRQTRQQKSRKIKILQKNNQQLKAKYQDILKNYQQQKKQLAQSKQTIQQNNKKLQNLQQQLKNLQQKNKLLQDMKQKSTLTLLQKYKKCLQLVESLQKQNVKLKNQLQFIRNKSEGQAKQIQQRYKNQVKKYQQEFQKIKQNIHLKESLIEEKKKQAQYFRDAYEKKDQEFMELVKSQHKLIDKQRQRDEQQKKKQQKQSKEKQKEKEKKQKELQKQRKQNENQSSIKRQKSKSNQKQRAFQTQNGQISRESSVIQMPQTLMPGNKQSFQGFESDEQFQQQDQFDESCIPISVQTKSLGKPVQVKPKKSQRKNILSSQSRKKSIKNPKKQLTPNLGSSPLPPKKHQKGKKPCQQAHSFTMKSCQPPHRITFQDNPNSSYLQPQIINSYYYTYSNPHNSRVHPLQHDNQYHNQNHNHNNNQCQYYQNQKSKGKYQEDQVEEFRARNGCENYSYTVDQALLIELEKQLLMLYTEQENLILASNGDFATQGDRSEYVGRIRQINEQLRIKSQKMCELKSKI